MSFTIGPGWRGQERVRAVGLVQRNDPNGLFLSFDNFFSSETVATAVSRLSSTPGIRASAPAPASLGGATGQRLDIAVSAPGGLPNCAQLTGGEPCLILFGQPGSGYVLEPGDLARVYLVSVREATLAVIIEAPAAEFPAFAAQAEQVIATVRFP